MHAEASRCVHNSTWSCCWQRRPVGTRIAFSASLVPPPDCKAYAAPAAALMLQTRKVLVSSVMGKFGRYQVRSRDQGAEGGPANEGACLAL